MTDSTCSASVTFEGGSIVQCTREDGHGFAHQGTLTGHDERGYGVTVEVEW